MSQYGYSDDPYIDEYMYRTHGGRVSGTQPGGIGSSAQRPTFHQPNQMTTDTQNNQQGGQGGGLGSILGAITGLLGKAKDAAGLGGVNPLLLALAGLQGFNAADLSKKSTQYATDAFSGANQDWKDRAGLRSMGIAGLESNARPDLSELTLIRRALPGAAGVGVTGGGPALPPLAGGGVGGGHSIADGPVGPTLIPTDPNIPFDPSGGMAVSMPFNDQIGDLARRLKKLHGGGTQDSSGGGGISSPKVTF